MSNLKINNSLPTEMKIGDRIYEVLRFLNEGENYLESRGHLRERAKELNAHLGKEDGQYLLEHQEDIPIEFQKEGFAFLFTNWHGWPSKVHRVAWLDKLGCWRVFDECLDSSYHDGNYYRRLLRRKS